MKSTKLLFILTIGLFMSCNGSDSNSSDEEGASNNSMDVENSERDLSSNVPLLKAVVDQEAMDQVGEWTEEEPGDDVIAFYHDGVDVERWTDKLWGRCCTEADMRLSEYMSYNLDVDIDNPTYPFENATDAMYSTAFVFDDNDMITITVSIDSEENFWERWGEDVTVESLFEETDTMMTKFQFSFINGYVKSEKTYAENMRIKKVELWLNGEHMCNVEILDTPEIQMIEGNFPLFMHDVVEIKPIEYYTEGTKYDDVCITELQVNLGYSLHPSFDEKYWELEDY